MLKISSMISYDQDNNFELREIYVSDGAVTYVLKKGEAFIPIEYPFPLEQIVEGFKGLLFSNLGLGPVRTYNDTDAKSLANYLHRKISSVNMSIPNAEKTLYDVISLFGEKDA